MKTVVSITELVEMGYPRNLVKRAVNSIYGSMFARRTSPTGKWYINLEKFEEYWNRGILERMNT